ncbi:MAG TPA: hypothetical protein VEJ38_11620 [Candidatus Acidoferrales bacterium]|nr:hypothetical protein [Candidatus Acidoferrales bacterium]
MRTIAAKKAWVARCAAVAAAMLASAWGAMAQMPGTEGQMGSSVPSQTAIGSSGGGMTDSLQFGTMGHEVEREQDAAYKAFLKEPEPVRKIKLGDGFLKKYPKSPFTEQVDVGMMNAYRESRDWKDSFRYADSALVLEPDDVDVLTIVGWTIPHVSDPKDPDHEQLLTKAETYSKHALDVMAKIPKPRGVSDADFAAAKAKRTFQAHSALGLVYFRRNDYENSATELALATKNNPAPDPTDLFILGADYQNLKRYGEAADAYGGCAAITGALQDRCKQSAAAAKAASTDAK